MAIRLTDEQIEFYQTRYLHVKGLLPPDVLELATRIGYSL